MPNEGFLRRWSRLKAEPAPAATAPAAVPAVAPALAPHPAAAAPAFAPDSAAAASAFAPDSAAAASAFAPDHAAGGRAFAPDARSLPSAGAPGADAPSPTLVDAALLDTASDYSAFVARGVDADVRRLAMKKLFADPHFNVIDGLDIYMADYNVPSPVSAAMLASLSHAKSVFPHIEELLEPAAGDAAPSLTTAAADDQAAPSFATAAASDDAAPSLTTAVADDQAAPSFATAAASDDAAPSLTTAAADDQAAPSLTTAASATEAPAPPPPHQEVA